SARHLHSFPTRRSSDLGQLWQDGLYQSNTMPTCISIPVFPETPLCIKKLTASVLSAASKDPGKGSFLFLDDADRYQHPSGCQIRSEEHTSELQSRFDLV